MKFIYIVRHQRVKFHNKTNFGEDMNNYATRVSEEAAVSILNPNVYKDFRKTWVLEEAVVSILNPNVYKDFRKRVCYFSKLISLFKSPNPVKIKFSKITGFIRPNFLL